MKVKQQKTKKHQRSAFVAGENPQLISALPKQSLEELSQGGQLYDIYTQLLEGWANIHLQNPPEDTEVSHVVFKKKKKTQQTKNTIYKRLE